MDLRTTDSDIPSENKAFASWLYDSRLSTWRTNRQGWTDTWIKNWYNFIGKYKVNDTTRTKEGTGQRSKAFIKLTKAKVMSAYAQIVAVGLESKEFSLVRPRSRTPNRFEEDAAKNMQYEIQLQQQDGDYYEQLKTMILELCLYGTSWIEGPMTRNKIVNRWTEEKVPMEALMMGYTPKWNLTEEFAPVPRCFHRDLFQVYPDMFATSHADSEGVFYAPFVTEYELKGLMNVPGFNKEEIKQALSEGPASAPYGVDNGPSEKLATRGITDYTRKGYELITFFGLLDAKQLREFRTEITGSDDGTGVFNVFAWLVKGNGIARTIKIVVNPYSSGYRPMNRTVFEANPFEINGNGIATNMQDSQDVINSAVRLYIDSKAFAGIPMVGINRNLLHIKGGKLGVHPGKVFEFNSDPTKAMHLMTISDSSDSILSLVTLMERFADETSGGGSKYTQGTDSKSLNRTAAGISMIMRAASLTLQTVAENVDTLNERIGDGYYQWNMEFNPDPLIKGDFIIRSNGISSAMTKETLNRQLMEFLGFLMNPMIYQIPPAMKLIKQIGDNMGIKNVDDLIPTDDEAAQIAKNLAPLENVSDPGVVAG